MCRRYHSGEPASYPVTIQLYNNATINAQNRTQVSYGYWIDEAGTGTIYTGISDTVVFNNPTAPHTAPTRTPGFSIDGFAPTPLGLLRDAEIDIVGDIGGDNAVFRSVNGSVNLEYSNASVGGWQNVPSAYNFGADTGETSTGIADYWMPAHTLEINQGPAMLYGLWNARPSVSVAPGDIQLSGTVTPSYRLRLREQHRATRRPVRRGRAGRQPELAPHERPGSVQHVPPATGRSVDAPILRPGLRLGLGRGQRDPRHREYSVLRAHAASRAR